MYRHAAWILWRLFAAGLLLMAPGLAAAQPFSSGSTGADGPFNPTVNTTVTLPPSGVFNFTTINVPAGVTVTFTRNAANTPATLLATGDVTIAGTLDLNGQIGGNGTSFGTATAPNGGLPGPGGAAGGSGSTAILTSTGGTGLGAGGGAPGIPSGASGNPHCSGAGGGHTGAGGNGTGGPAGTCFAAGGTGYGGARLLPILGGSGGGGGSASFGSTAGAGGGGGGAILLASSTRITLTGTIRANGGDGGFVVGGSGGGGSGGGGSGGAIRLVAPILAGSGGFLQVAGGAGASGSSIGGFPGTQAGNGGNGAPGRIRLEASTFSLIATMTVTASQGLLGTVTLASPPSLRITSVAGVAAPAGPQGNYGTPDLTLPAGFTNPVAISIEGAQIPPGTGVTVRSTPLHGNVSTATGSLTGTTAASTASVNLSLPGNQPTVLAAEATFALLTTASLDGPTRFAGEPITHVRVAATFGGASTLTYITASGKEVPAERLMAGVADQ